MIRQKATMPDADDPNLKAKLLAESARSLQANVNELQQRLQTATGETRTKLEARKRELRAQAETINKMVRDDGLSVPEVRVQE